VELNNLYSLPNVVRVVKSKRIRWAGHVAPMEEERDVRRLLVEKPDERGHWGDPDVDGKITLRRIIRMLERFMGNGWRWFWVGADWGPL
jgi:hypothetical protein